MQVEAQAPAPEEQARLVRARQLAAGSQLFENETWYVLSKRWWDSWRSYTGFDESEASADAMDVDDNSSGRAMRAARPRPIDNSELVAEAASGQLRRGVQEYADFVLLPDGVWKVLCEWYGGGPALPRTVVAVGTGTSRELRIELFPLRLSVCRTDDVGRPLTSEARPLLCPRNGLVPALVEMACAEFDVYVGSYTEGAARVWHFKGVEEQEGDAFKNEGWVSLNSTSRSMEELGLADGALIMLEMSREKPSTYNNYTKKVEWPFFHRCRLDYKRVAFKDPVQPGNVLAVNDRIDAGVPIDEGTGSMTWYPATVVGEEQSRVLVQFHSREKPKTKLPPLLTDGGYFSERQFTAEAKAGLEAVFKRYATGGKIDKGGLRGLLSCATNMMVQDESPQVSNLLNTYGDGSTVELEGFLKHWHSRAMSKNMWLEDELTRLFDRVGATNVGTEDDKLLQQGKEWIPRNSNRLGLFRSHDYPWNVGREKTGFRDFRKWDSLDAKLDGVWKQAEVQDVNWDEMAILVTEKTSSSSGYSSTRQGGEWIGMESERLAEFETKSVEQEDDSAPLLTRTQSGGGVCLRPGACGLQNLGNTCFMNATLQCLSNCGALRVYFAGSPVQAPTYVNSLSSSPLSMNGRLAREFGRLLAQMWSNTQTSCAPHELKSLIGQKRAEFTGYQQQDAQELLTFMLDGLHEDVNTAPFPRPIQPDVESNNRPDKEVAAEAWSNYLKCNNSRIVNLFQFQIRSEVTCPVCANLSVTFDPIMYLTLPVPKPPHSLRVTVVPLTYPRIPMTKMDVQIPRGATFGELEQQIIQQLGLQPDGTTQLVFADVWSDRIDRIFEHTQRTSEMQTSVVLYAHEVRLPPAARAPNAVRIFVPVLFKRENKGHYKSDDRCAPPRLICIAKDASTNAEVASQLLAFSSDLMASALAAPPTNDAMNDAAGDPDAVMNGELPQAAASAAAVAVPAAPIVHLHSVTEVVDLYTNVDYGRGDLLPNDDAPFAWEVGRYSYSNNRSVCAFFKREDVSKPLPLCLPEVIDERGGTGGGSGTSTTLRSCLLKNAEKEQLAEEDSVYCRKCKEHRRCWKKIELFSLPSVLIVHLKRFGRDRLDGPLTRIDTPVEFPVELDLRPYLAQHVDDAAYELFGVVNHHGTMGGGHYTAHGLVTSASDDGTEPRPDGEWFYFNDSSATKADVKDFDNRACYILFYRRRARRH